MTFEGAETLRLKQLVERGGARWERRCEFHLTHHISVALIDRLDSHKDENRSSADSEIRRRWRRGWRAHVHTDCGAEGGGEAGGAVRPVVGTGGGSGFLSDSWSPHWDEHTALLVSSFRLEPDVDCATVSSFSDCLTVLLTVYLPACLTARLTASLPVWLTTSDCFIICVADWAGSIETQLSKFIHYRSLCGTKLKDGR